MKKVKVLFSALAVVALAAGVFAAKASVTDKIYVKDPATPLASFCTLELNNTLIPNGAPLQVTIATTVQNAPIDAQHCTTRSIYVRF